MAKAKAQGCKDFSLKHKMTAIRLERIGLNSKVSLGNALSRALHDQGYRVRLAVHISGSKQEVADMLGMSVRQVYRLIEK